MLTCHRTIAILAPPLLALSAGCACPQAKKDMAPTAPAAQGAPKETPSQVAPAQTPTADLSFSESGFAKIDKNTPSDLPSIEAALPGCTVDSSTRSEEGTEFDVYEVRCADKLSALVIPSDGFVATIVVMSTEARSDKGTGLHSTYPDLVAAHGKLECYGGTDDKDGMVLCWTANMQLGFFFEAKNDTYAEKLIPEGKRQEFVAGSPKEISIQLR